jgi:hypothetical protein
MGAEPGSVPTASVAAALLGALFAATAILAATSPAAPPAAAETFFAVRRFGSEIVEVDLRNGRVVRTIVDLGGDPEVVAESGGLIDGVTLAADGRALYFSRYSREPGAVYRAWLGGGEPERVADGHGASVSPDGRWLALIRGADAVIRDLNSHRERVFQGVVGDLGGVETVWVGDGGHLAIEISGADISVVNLLDVQTGERTELRPAGEAAINYRVRSPAYRPSDGLLGVVCCHDGEIVEGEAPGSMTLVLHDPASGAERHRIGLPVPVWDIDWDRTGWHLLFTDGDRVRRYSDGRFRDVPEIGDVYAVAW